jgi:hypothetical protein
MAKIAACDQACLYRAGRGRFSAVQNARIQKTTFWVTYPHEFMNALVCDIQRIVNRARKLGMTPLIRLNGTSDILWENQSVVIDPATAAYLNRYGDRKVEAYDTYDNVMSIFRDITFYDYTKIPTRTVPRNYDLTFSYSATPAYQKMVDTARARGMRMAVVFRYKKDIPESFQGMKVIDGDDTDIRHLDPQGVVVSLYAKGPAIKDQTGFVIDAEVREAVLV